MNVESVVWSHPDGERSTYLRDPYVLGSFLRGIECNEHGVGSRAGCSEDAETLIHVDRVVTRRLVDVAS